MEYIGEVIPQTEFIRRTREYDAEGFKHYYFMTLKNDEVSLNFVQFWNNVILTEKTRLLMQQKEAV